MPATEIPDPDYHIVVFENRFPSYTGDQGRAEVVCYTPDHDSSLGQQSVDHIRDLIEVWRDRTAELGRLPNVRYVYVFENRGEEIGVTLSHPHGQIYAYPFVPPVLERELAAEARHMRKTGRCLYCDVIQGEEDGVRTVLRDERWIAFVRAPVFIRRGEEAIICQTKQWRLSKSRRPGRLSRQPARVRRSRRERPPGRGHAGHHFHIEFYPPNRTRDKLKYLAGSELGAGAFILDARAEDTAAELRALKV